MDHDFKTIEPKWQKRWEEAGAFRAGDDRSKPKFYALVEFPYPSGAGMHIGHVKAYAGRRLHICELFRGPEQTSSSDSP